MLITKVSLGWQVTGARIKLRWESIAGRSHGIATGCSCNVAEIIGIYLY